MPYAIVGISVITALLPRMSAHAAERRFPLVRDDFSTGVRLSSVIVVPAALLLIVLGGPLAELLFGIAHGSTSVAGARYIGEVFGVFSLGLVPYMMFQLLLRVFYSLHDSRTPMFIGVAVMAANIGVSLLVLNLVPTGHIVEGLGVSFGVSNVVGAVLSWRILSRRLGGLAGRQIADSLGRMHAAAVPALLFAWAVTFMVGVVLSPGPALRVRYRLPRRQRRSPPVPAVFPRARDQRGGQPDVHREEPAAPVNGAATMRPRNAAHTCTDGPRRGYPEAKLVSLTCNGFRWRGMRDASRRPARLSMVSSTTKRARQRPQIRGLGRRVEGLPRS